LCLKTKKNINSEPNKQQTNKKQIAPLRGWPLQLPSYGDLLNMDDKSEKQTPIITLGDLLRTPEKQPTLSDLFESES